VIISIPSKNVAGLAMIKEYFQISEEKEYKWRMRNGKDDILIKSNLIYSLLDINTTIS